MSAAAGFPSWLLLEPIIFRRDDDESFPHDTVAPFRASGTTSWGADFRIAFSLAEPPQISRLYAQLPGFRGPLEAAPLHMMATHRHLALMEIGTARPSEGVVHDFFIFRANKKKPSSSSLTVLPPCTEPQQSGSLRSRRGPRNDATPRWLDCWSLGLWCGDEEELVVAELTLYSRTLGRSCIEAAADICSLRSSFTDDGRRKWDTMRVPILCTTDDDLWKLSRWQNDAVIPFQRWLCWVDYHQGTLFWDGVSQKSVPDAPTTISFLWFPADKYSLASTQKTLCSGNGAVSVVGHGRSLKFVYVARHDGGPAYGVLKPGTGFTITCHTLVLGGDNNMAWKEDYAVTSDQLPDHLQLGGMPLYPRVDIDRPHM